MVSSAYTLFGLLSLLLIVILTFFVLSGGPIAAIFAYVAMLRRLEQEHPELMEDSWDVRWGDGHPGVTGTYFKTYGLDENVAQMIGGMVVTISVFYSFRSVLAFLDYVLKSFGVGVP